MALLKNYNKKVRGIKQPTQNVLLLFDCLFEFGDVTSLTQNIGSYRFIHFPDWYIFT